MYYTRDGKEISLEEWCETTDRQRRVAETIVNGKWVSTVYMGLNHAFGGGPPLIFETMIFPIDENGEVSSWAEEYCERYSTEEQALKGHERAVQMVRDATE